MKTNAVTCANSAPFMALEEHRARQAQIKALLEFAATYGSARTLYRRIFTSGRFRQQPGLRARKCSVCPDRCS